MSPKLSATLSCQQAIRELDCLALLKRESSNVRAAGSLENIMTPVYSPIYSTQHSNELSRELLNIAWLKM